MQDTKFVSFLNNSVSRKVSLLFLYRYISLLGTSFFYLVGPLEPLYFKMGVVLSLGIAAWIITDIQRKYINNRPILKSTVIAETIGLTLLLIPTGGISSPFIWYALNPVLIAASFLTPFFCWGALIFYLGSATIIANYFFYLGNLMSILEGKSYFYLVCFLTTLLARLFTGLTKELDSKAFLLKNQQEELLQVNRTLTETNEKYQQTLEQVMALYHLMDTFAAERSANRVAEEITESLLKCTQSDAAFFWLTSQNHLNSFIVNKTGKSGLETELIKEWPTICGKRETFVSRVKNDLYWLKIIKASNHAGVLGVKVINTDQNGQMPLINRPFDFLAELSEIMLDRIYIDQFMEQMLVIEEQNRIANEIHDSVSQRLFGIVYALHSLQLKGRDMSTEDLNKEYQFLSESANTTMKELRSAIFRLSSVKKGEKPFLVRLKKYLDEFARLNNVIINYQITGDESAVSDKLKQALYRVICEACGNAVRHGECNQIDLQFSISSEKTVLMIKDDGVGINGRSVGGNSVKGIGLINMQSLVSSFAGSFSIEEDSGQGTVINIEIPGLKMSKKQEVAG